MVADPEGAICGVVTREDLLKGAIEAAERAIGEIASTNYATIAPETTLFDVMSKMRVDGVPVVLVVNDAEPATARDVIGYITDREVGKAVMETIDPFPQ